MPRAKTATRDRLPPVKVLTKPRNVPCAAAMNSSSALASMPGVGMWHPIR